MPLYEHVYLARQDVSAQQVDELTAQFKGVIEQMGGKIAKTEYWGMKSLSYRMRKNRKAHFTLMNVEAPRGRAHRGGAARAPERRHSALPDGSGRSARGGPLGRSMPEVDRDRDPARNGAANAAATAKGTCIGHAHDADDTENRGSRP